MAVKREQVVQTAEKYVSRGKIEPAIREYRKLLEENPNDINTLNRVGDLYARIQRIDEAVDFFNQIAEQYSSEGFFVKAIAIYKKIIKLDPTRLDVYESLAELYHRQGLVTEARTQYQVLADYYQKHDNSTSTIAIYQKMAELEPNNPSYHVKLAELYQQLKLTEKAMGEYRLIAEMMIEHGHPQEAERVYTRALAIDSENIGFITDAALKLKEAGSNTLVVRFLSAAVERNPLAERVVRLIGAPVVAEESPAAAARPPAPAPATPAASPPTPAAAVEEIEIDLDIGEMGEMGEMGEAAASMLPHLAEEQPAFEVDELEPAVPDAGAEAAGRAAARIGGGGGIGGVGRAGEAAEIELELDDAFVLDIEDEAEPPSLVKPPPDMLEAPHRPPWAQESPAAAPGTAAGAAAPAWSAAPQSAPAAGEPAAAEGAGLELIDPLADIDGIELLNPFAAYRDLAPLAPVEGVEPSVAEAAAAASATSASGAARPVMDVRHFPEVASDAAAFPERSALAGEIAAGFAPDAGSRPPADEAPPPAAPAPGIKIDSDLLERTAAELQPQTVERYEDLVSEAEVLAKYGLEEKAAERLREALRLKPHRIQAYGLLIQLYFDKGRHSRVVDLANRVSRICERSGDREPWLKLRRKLLAAGYRLDGERVASVPAAREAPAVAPAAALPTFQEIARPAVGAGAPAGPTTPPASLAQLEEIAAAARSAAKAAPPASPRKTRKAEREIDQMLAGLLPAAREPGKAKAARKPSLVPPAPPSGIAEPAVPAAAAPAAAPAPVAPPAPSAPEVVGLPPLMPAAPAQLPPVLPFQLAPPAGPAETAGEEVAPLVPGVGAPPPPEQPVFNPLEIGAMIESQGLEWDETVDTQPPAFGRPAAAAAAGVAAGPAAFAPPPPPSQPSGRRPGPLASGLDDTGMSWLDEVDSGKRKGAARSSHLFDEEEDFFDLARELEQELSKEPVFQGDDLLIHQEQSLEEIVEGFKRGVAEHLSPTDYDTHFNLGIAYREMGLLDEAIGEFQLSAKDARYLVQCCSMLGLCFLDKGLPELAIKWYRRGLEAPDVTEDDTLGLLYDLGCVYVGMGDADSAYKTFVEVYGINTNYRDVVARIEELGRPH
ncbi:MAG TPA: hypothetical protein VHR45_05240 [Thermoanaerobaculia bacterium]|nr:hypothetical protein [Thermoanaerobaculia bacterium]